MRYVQPLGSYEVVSSLLTFSIVKNSGMAFGLPIGNRLFFIIFTSIASVVVVIFLFRIKPENFWARFAMASILGGAVGNLIDRIIYKQVIDFIEINFIRWPVFNIADVAVTIGMIILISYVIFDKRPGETEEDQLETNRPF